MGEHNAAAFAKATKCGQENWTLEVLGLINDDERIGEASSTDVGEGEDLEEFAMNYFIDNFGTSDCFEAIEYCRSPWAHLFEFRTG